jgi:hypothetical protein
VKETTTVGSDGKKHTEREEFVEEGGTGTRKYISDGGRRSKHNMLDF